MMAKRERFRVLDLTIKTILPLLFCVSCNRLYESNSYSCALNNYLNNIQIDQGESVFIIETLEFDDKYSHLSISKNDDLNFSEGPVYKTKYNDVTIYYIRGVIENEMFISKKIPESDYVIEGLKLIEIHEVDRTKRNDEIPIIQSFKTLQFYFNPDTDCLQSIDKTQLGQIINANCDSCRDDIINTPH